MSVYKVGDSTSTLVMIFATFSVFYPINLYIFEFIFSKKNDTLKVKVASITFSCLILSEILNFSFDFTWNWRILKWFLIGIGPFVLPWLFTEPVENEGIGTLLFWRNFVIAPTCEEFYYRILLPKINENIWLLSISFSLAHAHPFMFQKNWKKKNFIMAQCFISFWFGFICNVIRLKMDTGLNNFWVFLALSTIHGIANYCGVPLIELEKGKILFFTQIFTLLNSLYLICKK